MFGFGGAQALIPLESFKSPKKPWKFSSRGFFLSISVLCEVHLHSVEN